VECRLTRQRDRLVPVDARHLRRPNTRACARNDASRPRSASANAREQSLAPAHVGRSRALAGERRGLVGGRSSPAAATRAVAEPVI